MAAKRKDYEDLIKPEAPGTIDKTAVNNAAQGVTAAKSAFDSMSYDNFKQGSMYDGLKKSYEQQGQQAMKDTIGQVAARTGGMASSWAATAGQQSYNNYMQQLEDVARSMYNDEYSKARDKVDLAQNEYNRAYGEYRDSYDDAWDAYDRDMQAYRYDVEDQRYAQQLEQEAKTTKDAELKGILGAEGFLWGDWDGDGNVEGEREDKTFEDLYGGSSYGEDYWKAYAAKAATDNEVAGYTYARTADGANNILGALANSASRSLSAKDQKNFDYIFGDGAYKTVQDAINEVTDIQIPTTTYDPQQGEYRRHYSDEQADQRLDAAIDLLIKSIPGITMDQILDILESASPDAMRYYFAS